MGKGKGHAKDMKDGNKLKKCSYCKKKGHIKDKCRKLKAHLESKPSDSKSTEKKEGDLTAKVVSDDDKRTNPRPFAYLLPRHLLNARPYSLAGSSTLVHHHQ